MPHMMHLSLFSHSLKKHLASNNGFHCPIYCASFSYSKVLEVLRSVLPLDILSENWPQYETNRVFMFVFELRLQCIPKVS